MSHNDGTISSKQDRFNVKAVIQSALDQLRELRSDPCGMGDRIGRYLRPSPKEKDTEGRSFLMGDRRIRPFWCSFLVPGALKAHPQLLGGQCFWVEQWLKRRR